MSHLDFCADCMGSFVLQDLAEQQEGALYQSLQKAPAFRHGDEWRRHGRYGAFIDSQNL
jgi:hypothetical protein